MLFKNIGDRNKNTNSLLKNRWNIKFFSSDGIGSATGKFPHKMQNYKGETQYNSILPIASRASRIRGLYSFDFGRLGAELYRKKNLSLHYHSRDMYSASHNVDIKENGISLILEKTFKTFNYWLKYFKFRLQKKYEF